MPSPRKMVNRGLITISRNFVKFKFYRIYCIRGWTPLVLNHFIECFLKMHFLGHQVVKLADISIKTTIVVAMEFRRWKTCEYVWSLWCRFMWLTLKSCSVMLTAKLHMVENWNHNQIFSALEVCHNHQKLRTPEIN